MLNDIQSHRTLSYNLEVTSQDMQRYVAQLEQDKTALRAQVSDWQREAEIAKKHIEMERARSTELEKVVAQERRHLHERDLDSSSVFRDNDDLRAECERMNLRIQSLQSHIDSLQKY
jgi:peptidoglycan hydrolase CwlO-like protein